MLSTPVWPVWPGRTTPMFSGGQSVWIGCGSEVTSSLLLLWFTKLTRDPTGTVTTFGLTPLGRMVMVAASPGRGDVFPPPPFGLPGDPLPPKPTDPVPYPPQPDACVYLGGGGDQCIDASTWKP